ncbi:MAG: hypothetical protein ACAH83_06100 [Alphaproteobacteria bacterium]
MANVSKLTEEQLKNRIEKMTRRNKVAKWVFGLCLAAGCLVGAYFPPALLAWNTLAIAVSFMTALYAGNSTWCCGDELTERTKQAKADDLMAEKWLQHMAAKARAAALTPMPSPAAEDFNPAAATVLENDMRSMAPLRLKKLAKYVETSNG